MTTRLSAGDAAPPFSLTDADGQTVSLSDFAGKKVIVYFYPAAMTPGCTTQAVDFTAALPELDDSTKVLGISPDATEKLRKFTDKSEIGFPLLSDPEKETLAAYAAYGKKMMYGKEIEGVIRSTFVIDVDSTGKGTVSKALYNVKATGHVARLLRDL